jgi:signal transduction histidine kinase
MDITDQKLLEKRLRHAASFPHLNPNPVIEVDRGGRITYNNPASEKIAHRLKARDASVFLPADIGDILAIPQSEPLYREVEIAGQVFGETVSESLEFNTVRIFGTNITERKRAEIALRERTEELDRVVDAKNELIGVAAHDLRNPLFVLNAFCELLMRRRRSKNHQPILPFIETMRHQTNYMARLVDDLLDVSVIETGKLTLRSEPTDLADLLQRIVALQREVAAGKKISIHCRVSAPLPRVVIDRNKIEQVFNNLLINAIKFSPPASTITLDAEESGNRIVCAVRDQGGGIPRELLDQIFKPYFKGRRQGTAGEEGFGLGLAIARKIAAAHGGELVVKSKIGHGSTFMLILPLKDR